MRGLCGRECDFEKIKEPFCKKSEPIGEFGETWPPSPGREATGIPCVNDPAEQLPFPPRCVLSFTNLDLPAQFTWAICVLQAGIPEMSTRTARLLAVGTGTQIWDGKIFGWTWIFCLLSPIFRDINKSCLLFASSMFSFFQQKKNQTCMRSKQCAVVLFKSQLEI